MSRGEFGGNLGNLGTRYQFLVKLCQAPSPRFPFIPIGSGLNRRTLVYDKDVGRAAALAVAVQKELGFIPQYDLKAGWEEAIREMRGKIV